jgi:hypothetical protein
MSALIIVLLALVPFAFYFWREHKMATPSLQWPVLAKILALTYEADPPRMSGNWNGRRIAVEHSEGKVLLTAWLSAATSLRVECGPKELVTKRAGIVLQDPFEPTDRAFAERLLARCSDKAAGPTVFDSALQQRLRDLPSVDFIGQDTRVVWTLPEFKDPNAAEAVLGALCAVADGLESFPQSGGLPNAKA